MAIRVHLDDILRARGMTAKELCAKVGITFLDCDVGDILKFDGQLEADDDE